MNWLIAFLGLSVVATIATGIWLELKPRHLPSPRILKGSVLANFLFIGLGLAGMLMLGVQEVLAAEPLTVITMEISLGKGLALIGIGLPTAWRRSPPGSRWAPSARPHWP